MLVKHGDTPRSGPDDHLRSPPEIDPNPGNAGPSVIPEKAAVVSQTPPTLPVHDPAREPERTGAIPVGRMCGVATDNHLQLTKAHIQTECSPDLI